MTVLLRTKPIFLVSVGALINLPNSRAELSGRRLRLLTKSPQPATYIQQLEGYELHQR